MGRIWILLIFLVMSAQATTNMWVSAGQAYGIEPRLLYAISKVESNLRPFVVSVNYKKFSILSVRVFTVCCETKIFLTILLQK